MNLFLENSSGRFRATALLDEARVAQKQIKSKNKIAIEMHLLVQPRITWST